MTNIKFFIAIVLISFFAVVFETTIFNFPFVFILASILLLFTKRLPGYIAAFILGFLIDSLRVSNFGMTPIFIFATEIGIFLYEKLFGSRDIVVASVIVGAMTFVYVYFLSYSITLLISFFILLVFGMIVINILKKRGVIFS